MEDPTFVFETFKEIVCPKCEYKQQKSSMYGYGIFGDLCPKCLEKFLKDNVPEMT